MGLFWGKKKSTIVVTFINVADESIMGRCDMPADNLPDGFDVATQMSISNEQ